MAKGHSHTSFGKCAKALVIRFMMFSSSFFSLLALIENKFESRRQLFFFCFTSSSQKTNFPMHEIYD